MSAADLPPELKVRIARLAVPSLLVAKATRPPNNRYGIVNLVPVNVAEWQSAMAWFSLSFSHNDIMDEVKKRTTLRIEIWRGCDGEDDDKPHMNVDTGLLRAIQSFEIVDIEVTLFRMSNSTEKELYINSKQKHLLRYTSTWTRGDDDKVKRGKTLVDSYITPDIQMLEDEQYKDGAFARPWTITITATEAWYDLAELSSQGHPFEYAFRSLVAFQNHEAGLPHTKMLKREDGKVIMQETALGFRRDWEKKDVARVYEKIEGPGEMEWIQVYEQKIPAYVERARR